MLIKLADYMTPVRALSKPHKGIVVDNEDPKKLGRVKCFIEGLMEADKEDLPWILNPSDPSQMMIPEIGEELIIVFPFNDIYSPEIAGNYHSTANHNPDFDANYPKTFGLSRNGLKVLHNAETNDSHITHPNGSTLDVIEDGTMTLVISKDLILDVTGNYTKTVGGDLTLTVTGAMTINSTGDYSVSSDGNVSIEAGGTLLASGTSGTTVGDSGSVTDVNGSLVNLAGGGVGVALIGSTVSTVGVGNTGAPVNSTGTVTSGSSKVLAPM